MLGRGSLERREYFPSDIGHAAAALRPGPAAPEDRAGRHDRVRVVLKSRLHGLLDVPAADNVAMTDDHRLGSPVPESRVRRSDMETSDFTIRRNLRFSSRNAAIWASLSSRAPR
jgi:hypothetical protein